MSATKTNQNQVYLFFLTTMSNYKERHNYRKHQNLTQPRKEMVMMMMKQTNKKEGIIPKTNEMSGRINTHN